MEGVVVKNRSLSFVVLIATLMFGCGAETTAGDAAATPILPPVADWDGESRGLIADPDDPWCTPAEASGLERTPRYEETFAWLQRLVDAAPQLQMVSIGTSAEGRSIPMVIASREGAATPAALQAGKLPTLLAHSGIHSGEIDGKDAGMMLLRDMTVAGKRSELLKHANFLFIPILSVDGHERFSEFSRVNQRGPVEMGWRTNRRNLNLNRDFAKLETRELRALAATILAWQPDLYIDLHVTDGQDYQYDVTYGYNGAFSWSPSSSRWLDATFRPAVDRALKKMGHVPGPLAFGANGRDMMGGNVAWTAGPRFSNGWADARHLPAVLVENHSLKPYDQRVLGTYVLLDSALEILGKDFVALREASAADRKALGETVSLGWKNDPGRKPGLVPFKGIRSEEVDSVISGASVVRWTGEAVEQELPLILFDTPTVEVRRPDHYFIPAAWSHVGELLERQGIRFERTREPRTVKMEMYRLPDATLDVENSPFEGRTRYLPGDPQVERQQRLLPAGSLIVKTAQPLGVLAMLLLEPQSADSMFQWGYFSEILQRTEYVEAYVMEPMARAMMEADPKLKEAFEARLVADEKFAADPRARLQWFYEKTPFFDGEHRLYPIGRSLE
jgi:hypothetical protein